MYTNDNVNVQANWSNTKTPEDIKVWVYFEHKKLQ